MKIPLKSILQIGILLFLPLVTGCSEEHVDSISIKSSSTGNSPFKVEKIYYCDHTNHRGLGHAHPRQCGARNCPRLEPNGSFTPGQATGAACPDETSGGLGIKTQLEAMTSSATAILNTVKSQAISQIATKAGTRINSNAEVNAKLNARAKGRLSAGIGRELQASFSKKWAKEAEKSLHSKLEAKKSQLLAITATAGGTMGCGQENIVGIDYNIRITVTLHATATVRGEMDDDGSWTTKNIEWVNFTVDVSLGLVGPGLKADRHKTSCNCTPTEETKGADEGGDRKHGSRTVPRRFFMPTGKDENKSFRARKTVHVRSENLDDFRSESAKVFVLEEEKGANGSINKVAVLVPTAAAGGYAVYEIVANRNGGGKNLVTTPETLQSPDKDTIAYEVPESPGRDYEIEGMDRNGEPLRRSAHKLGTVGGKDILVLDNRDRAFTRLDRLSGGDENHDLATVYTDLKVHPQQKMGTILRGLFQIHASPCVEEKYRFDIILHAPGFQPMMLRVNDVKVNTPFALETLKLIATRVGSNDISVELLPVKR